MTDTKSHSLESEQKILVVANETVEGTSLPHEIRARPADVLVVAPALNSRLRHWVSDEDDARRRAAVRLATCIERLARAGIEASGLVGDPDPLQAITDALRRFPADEIMIATHPEGRPHWLARDLIRRARRRFSQPIVHVVAGSVDGRAPVESTKAFETRPQTTAA